MSKEQAQVPKVQPRWCPKCRFRLNVREGDLFCRYCATELEIEGFACECGRELDRLDVFCPKCRRQVEQPEQP